MLRRVKTLYGFRIHATDGEIGKVDDFFFDAREWTIRYIVVNTGNWLQARDVLLSIQSVERVDWDRKEFNTSLTRDMIRNSPDIDAHMPLHRQQEIELTRYYGWVPYWFTGGFYNQMPPPPPPPEEEIAKEPKGESHLRSARHVEGYHIQALNGEVGHAEDFIVDDENWVIRYLDADTRNWLPGKHVLIPPAWAEHVSWTEERIYVKLSMEQVRTAPDYDHKSPITRDYEINLFKHYGKRRYWEEEPTRR